MRSRLARWFVRTAIVLAALVAVLAAAGWAVLSQPQFGARMSGARLERAQGQSAVPRRPLRQRAARGADQPGGARSTTSCASSPATRCASRRRRCRCWRSTRRRSPQRRRPAACARSGSAMPASMSSSTDCACCSTRCSPSACRRCRRAAPLPSAADRAGRPAADRRRAHLARPLRPSRHGRGAPPGRARLALLRAAGHRRAPRALGRAAGPDRGAGVVAAAHARRRADRLHADAPLLGPRPRATAARRCGRAGR